MKNVLNISKLILMAFVIIASGSLTSCKKKKNVQQGVTPEQQGEVLLQNFCSGPEFFTNREFMRANSIGESLDQVTARRKAMSNARAQLAADINVVVRGTTDNYVNSSQYNNKEEVMQRFESLTREVIDQELRGVRTLCDKMTRTPEGRFKSYVAIELGGDELVGAINDRLSRDERIMIDYNYERFKDTFNQEMERLARERGF
ncbi:MAG: hypothetical protein ACXITV_00880 [Luteibaculaceae bacterium]